MLQTQVKRIVGLVYILCILTTLSSGGVADARPLAPAADSLFAVKGQYRVFDGTSFPATLYADDTKRRVWMDIEASPDYRSWAFFDWSLPVPTGYIGNDHQCFHMTLPASGFFPPSRLASSLGRKGRSEPEVDLDRMSQGLNVLQNLLILNDDEGIVVFEAEEVATARNTGELATAPPRFEASTCRPMRQLLERLSVSVDGEQEEELDSAPSKNGVSQLSRNHPYDFFGLGYHWLSYQGGVFQQTKTDYDAALSSCEQDGEGSCKPYWVPGGFFGRYGRYCGDGWGTGRGQPVSSLDYCCSLHDGESWDRSASFGHEARNLCGFAACLTCKYYVSPADWEVNFRGDFWASQPIGAFVAAGIAAAWCHPQSYFTGFHCR